MMMNRPNMPSPNGNAYGVYGQRPPQAHNGGTWNGPSFGGNFGINPAGRRRPPQALPQYQTMMPQVQQPQLEQPGLPPFQALPSAPMTGPNGSSGLKPFQPPQMQLPPSLPQGASNLPAVASQGNLPPWLQHLIANSPLSGSNG